MESTDCVDGCIVTVMDDLIAQVVLSSVGELTAAQAVDARQGWLHAGLAEVMKVVRHEQTHKYGGLQSGTFGAR